MNNKSKIIKIILVILILIISIFLIVLSVLNQPKKNNEQPPVTLETTVEEDTHSENFDKYNCDTEDCNVDWTECLIENLDKAAAEREWKQLKIETANGIQISEVNMSPQLNDEQAKISKWRENFETRRNEWCEATHTFVTGSGTPGSIAECELNFEIQAIKDVNHLYYEVIMKNVDTSTGIPNFEPTNNDIEKLTKTNKTKRGCVWAGEENCNIF